jgi:small neutral amino acid transporter SnatA (MarC family)
MMPAVMFMIGTPVAIAGVLVVVALSGRMSKARRDVIVRAAALVFYPACVLAAAFTGWTSYEAGEWLTTVLSAISATALVGVGVQIFRNPSLRRDGIEAKR